MPTVNLTFSAQHAQLIQESLEKALDLRDANGDPRSATVADYKQWVVGVTKQLVRDQIHGPIRKAAYENATVEEVDVT